ncbi:MAG: hypothetical protein KKB65_07575 [Nanoarchaeota archaeon]|nr:hypothetical protein [Nanoarchaeota archaeon]
MKFIELYEMLYLVKEEDPKGEEHLKTIQDMNLVKTLSEEESKIQQEYKQAIERSDEIRELYQNSLSNIEHHKRQLSYHDEEYARLQRKKRKMGKKLDAIRVEINNRKDRISELKIRTDSLKKDKDFLEEARENHKKGYETMYGIEVKIQPMIKDVLDNVKLETLKKNDVITCFDFENFTHNEHEIYMGICSNQKMNLIQRFVTHLQKYGVE